MNIWPSAGLAASLLLLLALAAGAEPVLLVEDPEGDVTTEAGQVQHGPVPDPVNKVDLAALWVLEDEDGFHFEVHLHETNSNIQLEANVLDVHLVHGGQTYRISMVADTPTGAALFRMDPITGKSSLVGPLEADFAPWYVKQVTVPRELLLDTDGAAPFPGRALDGFWVEAASWWVAWNEDEYGVWDRMPDEGVDGSYLVVHGLESTGDARLWSPAPGRASNGAANTFVFPVVAAHEGVEAATYGLRVAEQPDGWTVWFPGDVFRLEPGEPYRFPVLATLPSAHRHGGTETIRLVLEEVGGDSEASLDLNVVFHAIPQPAGHHPEVFLHSRAGSSVTGAVLPAGDDFLYMNALQEDPDDEKVAVHGRVAEFGTNEYSWSIPLHPSLQMGLDFDLGGTGRLTLPLASDAPVVGAEVRAELVWRHEGDKAVLAQMGPESFDLGPTGGHTAVLEWSPEEDLVPYQGLASLVLEVRLAADDPATPTGAAPRILPGGSLSLPLFEYEDPINPAFLEVPDTELVVVGAVERPVNAGRAASFDLELRSQPGAAASYRIDVTGRNADWARWPASLKVTPGQAQSFKVTVHVPEGAHVVESADLVVAAVPDGAGGTALARLRVAVEGGIDIPDEAGEAGAPGPGNATAGVAPVAVVAALGAALAWRRRA